MSYCVVKDVEDLMQQKFTNSTSPPMSKVAQLVMDVSADLDGVLIAAGYTLPITGTLSLSMLRRYTTYGVAAGAWHAGVHTDSDTPRVVYWTTEYREFIGRLRRQEEFLPDEDADNALTDPVFELAPFARR